MTLKTEKGFAHWLIIIVVVIIAAVGFVGWRTYQTSKNPIKPSMGQPSQAGSSQPSCPEPVTLQTPVDLQKVTAILYPGQERGGDFKPHGGFRFDNSKPDDITVVAPLDGKMQEAQRYTENGEEQYSFDFANSCGIVYRLDHLAGFPPKFEKFAQSLPLISEDEWKSGSGHEPQRGNLDVSVSKGETIATAVGFRKTNNAFVDFGVYDLRGKNTFQNPRPFAVCWFDMLPAADSAKVKSLPAGDSQNGKNSTLCK